MEFDWLRKITSLVLLLTLCQVDDSHSQVVAVPTNGKIIQPVGDYNFASKPQVRWSCTQGHTEASLSLTDLASNTLILQSASHQFSTQGTVCVGPLLGRVISPPFPKPPACSGPGCINQLPPKTSGLEIGKYRLSVKLHGSSVPDTTIVSNFNIVNNVNVSASSQFSGMRPLFGDWKISPDGLYTASSAPSLSLYQDPVFAGLARSTFFDGRRFHLEMETSCKSRDCYAGLVTLMTELGSSNGIIRYFRSEVVVWGDKTLSVQSVIDGSPPVIRTVADHLDVSKLLTSPKIQLIVHQSGTDFSSGTLVYINGSIAYCGNSPPAPANGYTGLVLSPSTDDATIKVKELTVSPTRYANVGTTLCRDLIPLTPP